MIKPMNKHCIIITVFLVLLIIFTMKPGTASAQNLVIKSFDGSEQSYTLDSISKLTFSGNNLVVNLASGINQPNSLTAVRKIYFSSVPVKVEDSKDQQIYHEVILYPNPVNDILTIQNMPEQVTNLEIFGLDGKYIMQAGVLNGNSVDVSALPGGSYFLKLNNYMIGFVKL